MVSAYAVIPGEPTGPAKGRPDDRLREGRGSIRASPRGSPIPFPSLRSAGNDGEERQ